MAKDCAASKTRVLIAKEGRGDPARFAMRVALETAVHLDVVAETGDARMVVKLAAEHQPDVVLIDGMVFDGAALTGEIHEVAPGAAVVLLADGDDPEPVSRVLDTGADAFLSSDVDLVAVALAVREVLADQSSGSWPPLARLLLGSERCEDG